MAASWSFNRCFSANVSAASLFEKVARTGPLLSPSRTAKNAPSWVTTYVAIPLIWHGSLQNYSAEPAVDQIPRRRRRPLPEWRVALHFSHPSRPTHPFGGAACLISPIPVCAPMIAADRHQAAYCATYPHATSPVSSRRRLSLSSERTAVCQSSPIRHPGGSVSIPSNGVKTKSRRIIWQRSVLHHEMNGNAPIQSNSRMKCEISDTS